MLGTGCPKCKLLEAVVIDAVAQLWIQWEIIKIQDMEDIMQYDIMSTPALVVDEHVVFSGRVPDIEEMMKILENVA